MSYWWFQRKKRGEVSKVNYFWPDSLNEIRRPSEYLGALTKTGYNDPLGNSEYAASKNPNVPPD